MTRRGRAQHRVDATARELIDAAKLFGAHFAKADGTYDGVLWVPSSGRLEIVDWKGPKGKLTPSQTRLLAQGWPLRFISTRLELQALIQDRR